MNSDNQEPTMSGIGVTPERVVMDESMLSTQSFVGWCLIEVMSAAAEEQKRKTGSIRAFEDMFMNPPPPAGTPTVLDVELKINGHQIDLIPALKFLGRQWDDLVEERAMELVSDIAGAHAERVTELMQDAVRQALRA